MAPKKIIPFFAELGKMLNLIRSISAELTQANVHLKIVAGSISELSQEGNVYNTCLVFGNGGQIEAKHRKIHLFDIDTPG